MRFREVQVNDELKPSLKQSGYSVQSVLTGTVTGFLVGLDNINTEVKWPASGLPLILWTLPYLKVKRMGEDDDKGLICRGVQAGSSASGGRTRLPSQRAVDEQRFLGLIRESYDESGRTYGAPRIFCNLREAGDRVGKNRVARIM